MILVLSSHDDLHAQTVLRELERRGAAARLVDLSEFPSRMSLTARFDADFEGFSLTFADGLQLPLEEVSAVWWRRPQPFSLPAEVRDPVHRHFALTESATAFQGMWQSSPALWVNDVVKDAAAAHKPWQLHLAREVGLSIPETLITNEPEVARAFWREHPGAVIYKPFLQSLHAWRETRILRAEEEELAASVRVAPVLFQRYVPAQADLRVTIVGERIFAAAAPLAEAAYPVDVRLNLTIPYRVHALPAEIEEKLLALQRRLGLEYGAVDLRLTPEGEYVFFEVNPAGQFLYIENATGQPIAAALAEHLQRGVAAAPAALAA